MIDDSKTRTTHLPFGEERDARLQTLEAYGVTPMILTALARDAQVQHSFAYRRKAFEQMKTQENGFTQEHASGQSDIDPTTRLYQSDAYAVYKAADAAQIGVVNRALEQKHGIVIEDACARAYLRGFVMDECRSRHAQTCKG